MKHFPTMLAELCVNLNKTLTILEYNNAAVADSPTSPAIISQPGYEIPGHPTGPGFQSDPYEIRYGPSQHFQVPMRDYPRDPPPPYSPPPPAPTFPQQHTKY